jgi:hypothetical protein
LPDNLAGLSIDLNTDKNTMPAALTEAHKDDGRPLIAGTVDLYFRTSSRILVLRIDGEPDRLFMLKLARNPPTSPDFGPWQRVDYVADGRQGEPRKAGAATLTRSDTGWSGPIERGRRPANHGRKFN